MTIQKSDLPTRDPLIKLQSIVEVTASFLNVDIHGLWKSHHDPVTAGSQSINTQRGCLHVKDMKQQQNQHVHSNYRVFAGHLSQVVPFITSFHYKWDCELGVHE